VVGLGDSVPAGSECGCTSYVSPVAQQAAHVSGNAVSVRNLAVGGLTTAGLGAQLRRPGVRSALARADVVILTIGANDFDEGLVTTPSCSAATGSACYRPGLDALGRRLASAVSQVRALQAGHGVLLLTGYWNVFKDGAVGRDMGTAYVTASDALTRAVNAKISGAAGAGGARYVDLYRPFKADGSADCTALLAADGDHPNGAGHQLIARTVMGRLGLSAGAT
jgi:lysophospholipase L1-like esterase